MSDGPDQIDVTLPRPVTLNGEVVCEFVLTREPTGRDLGKHTVVELLEGDARAIATVAPKLIQPHLSRQTILGFSTANLMALQAGFSAFFEGVDFDARARPKETAPPSAQAPAPATTSTKAKTGSAETAPETSTPAS